MQEDDLESSYTAHSSAYEHVVVYNWGGSVAVVGLDLMRSMLLPMLLTMLMIVMSSMGSWRIFFDEGPPAICVVASCSYRSLCVSSFWRL